MFQLAASLSKKNEKIRIQDRNKRTALVAADMFLKINGYRLQIVPLQEDHTAEQLGEFYQSVATAVDSWSPEIVRYITEATEN
ncbi:MAG: hypothetical protein M1833_004398 [Piccolia ochrophora]|nr:MAG: hypothetical protein M1833_004398 [Piccolia ochrophora]